MSSSTFSHRQLLRILPPAATSIVQSTADTEKLELSTPPRPHAIATASTQLCEETLALLNSEAKAGRAHARTILTRLILDGANIDRSGEMITTLISTWKEDLISSISALPGVDRVLSESKTIQVIAPGKAPQALHAEVRGLLDNEWEHTDWLATLIVTRAAIYRPDLEEIAVALSDYCKQRAEASILLVGVAGSRARLVRPKQLELIHEQDFLCEILEALEENFRALSDEHFPEPIAEIVEEQILCPSDTEGFYERLAELVLATDQIRVGYPEAEVPSHAELVEEIKERAERLMRAIDRQSSVFFERATHRYNRCAELGSISPFEGSMTVQLAQIEEFFADEIDMIIPNEERHPEILRRFRDELYALQSGDSWNIDRPHVFSIFIPGDPATGEEPRAIFARLAFSEIEEPDFDADDDDEIEAAAGEDEDIRDEGEPPFIESEDSTIHVLEDRPSAEPLDFSLVALEPIESRLLSDAEKLARWFAVFTAHLTPLKPGWNDIIPLEDDAELSATEDDSTPTFQQNDDEDLWESALYYGRSTEECERAFQGLFAIMRDRYPTIWELLPETHQKSPTMIPVSQLSPLRQAIDLLRDLEDYNRDVARIPPPKRETLRSWIELYAEHYATPTSELLFSLPLWGRAANIYRPDDATPWRYDEREESLNNAPAVIASTFFDTDSHLLLNSLTDRGFTTLTQLLEKKLIFLDGVCEAFVACLNKMPHKELAKRILHRHRGALGPERNAAFWHPVREEKDASPSYALRSAFGSLWIDIHRSFERGLL